MLSKEDQEYATACREMVEGDLQAYFIEMRQGEGYSDGYETPNSGDDDGPGQELSKWANSVSPLRGKAPLSLSHRNSVQKRKEAAQKSGQPHLTSSSDKGWGTKGDATHTSAFSAAAPAALGSGASFAGGILLACDETGLQSSLGGDVKQCLWLLCFDLISALRGVPCSFFTEVQSVSEGVPPKWSWAGHVVTSRLPVPPSTFGCINLVLAAADRLSQLRGCATTAVADSKAEMDATDGNRCLEHCGQVVLERFFGAVTMTLDEVDRLLLGLQESWDFLQEDPTVKLMRHVAHVEEACGFLLHTVHSASLMRLDVSRSSRAARLVDVCTLHAARAQAGGNTKLMSRYTSLMLLCAWPYYELFVPTIHGDNQPIDRNAWLSATPKIFRTSFQARCLEEGEENADADDLQSTSTDVLALVVSCEGIADKSDRRGRHSSTRNDMAHLLSNSLVQQSANRSNSNAVPLVLDEDLGLVLCVVNTALEQGYALTAACRSQGLPGESFLPVTLDTSIPFSHWLTITLLLPMASVVQAFHHSNLNALLTSVPPRTRQPAPSLASSGGEPADDDVGRITFDNALSLVRDIAIGAAWEKVIDTFLDRCTTQAHWWYRSRSMAAAEGQHPTYATCTTASKHISSHFLDAARSLPFGQYVKLCVLPNPHHHQHPKGEGSVAEEILATFNAMRLIFSFPEAIGIVLTPQQYYGNVAENLANGDPYSRMFSFLCAFTYTKKILLLRWKEQHHAELRSFSGIMRAAASTRGEGANNHQLAFLCDTVLRFTQSEGLLGIAKLKKRLELGDPRSVSAVCQFVDAFQLHIGVLCVAPTTTNRDVTFASLKKMYSQLLLLALDNNLATEVVTDQIRVVAAGIVGTLESLPEGSSLGQRLRPILLHLTFNRFY